MLWVTPRGGCDQGDGQVPVSLGDRSNTDSRGQVLNFVKDKVFKTEEDRFFA
jgi:hypothetical protein